MMAGKKTVGIGFIGTGAVAEFHAAAINQSESATLVGVWDLVLWAFRVAEDR